MPEEIKEKIYKFLIENIGKRFNMQELTDKSKIASRATILKWVAVLIAEKDRDPPINVEDYGNVKLIWVEEKSNEM